MGKRDLITKDFALYVVHYFASMQTWSKNEILSEIDRTIKEAKEDIVRCKDCKRSGMYDFGCGDRVHLACLEIEEDGFVIMATAVNDDDFCSHGERKEE